MSIIMSYFNVGLILLGLLPGTFSQSIFSSLETGKKIYSDVSLAIAPASPDCWLNTIQESFGDGESTSSLSLDVNTCSYLDTRHQQVFSLKLTQCHMETMGRPLVEGDDGSCVNISTNNVANCLSQLSDIGATTYTLFFKDVHQVCTRLLNENVANHYLATSQELAKISKLAERRWQSMINSWEDREEQLSSLILKQTSIAANHSLGLQEKMRIYHTQELEKHRQELNGLSETVLKTNLGIKPWTQSIEFLLEHATTTYSVVQALLTSLGTIVLLLIVTFPKKLQWMRLRLIGAVLMGTLAKTALLVFDNDNVVLSPPEKRELSQAIEDFLYHFLVTAYCGGLVSTLISSCRYQHDDEEPPSITDRQEKLLRRLEQIDQRWKDITLQQNHQRGKKESLNEIQRPILPPIVLPPPFKQEQQTEEAITPSMQVPMLHSLPPSAQLVPLTWNFNASPQPWTIPITTQRAATNLPPGAQTKQDPRSPEEGIGCPPKGEDVANEADQESVKSPIEKKRSAEQVDKETHATPDSKRQRIE